VIVPTDELRDVLIPAIDRYNAELNFAAWENEEGAPKTGALQIIAERSAKNLGTRVDSVPRRIHSVRKVEFGATNVTIADALLLAVDIYIEETDIVHLPQGVEAGVRMIEAWNAEHGVRQSKASVKKLAKKMVRFKNGYLRHDKYLAKEEARQESERYFEERREMVAA